MKAPTWLDTAARRAARLLAPSRCSACDVPVLEDGIFCELCAPVGLPLRHWTASGHPVVAVAAYDGGLAVAIRRLKYGARPDLAAALGLRLATAIECVVSDGPAVLVPVPLHPKRLAERGYNQSALLAGRAARALRWRTSAQGLRRVRHTDEQASLGRNERLTNLAGAFVASAALTGQRVVLVDDVVTTGATAVACAQTLEEVGASVVAVAAAARVI